MRHSSQRKPKILVVGDFFADRIVFHSTERESPEGGHPVVRKTHELNGPGGAGAVAAMCRALGVDVDEIGGGRPRALKCRHVIDGRAVFRVDDEATPWPADCDRHARWIRDAICDAIIVADYGKGVVTKSVFAAAVQLSAERRIPLLVDPARGVELEFYRGADAIFPNRREAGISSTSDAFAWVARTCRELELAACVAKLDCDGYVAGFRGGYLDAEWAWLRYSEVVDVSGAGDQFIAATAVAITQQSDWVRAVRWGNRLAGEKCRQWGATPVVARFRSSAVSER